MQLKIVSVKNYLACKLFLSLMYKEVAVSGFFFFNKKKK